MAFQDSTWTTVGELTIQPSTVKMDITWNILNYLFNCSMLTKMAKAPLRNTYSKCNLKSGSFSFAGAKWNFFASFDLLNKTHSLFGINVQKYCSSAEVIDCSCNISFHYLKGKVLKDMKFECKFKLQSDGSHWASKDFFTSSELQQFIEKGDEIIWTIHIKNIYKTFLQIENIHSTEGARALIQLPEIEDEDIPKSHPIYKVCQGLKQLLLSEEDSDVTFHVGDQEFKAHQSILKVRSSVFAAMFRHDTKEKATGVVNAEDCEPTSFPVFLEFLYCGSTNQLSVENVFSLYSTADKYDVQDLKTKCIDFIKNNLSVESFCATIKLGFQHSDPILLKIAIEFFAENFRKIIKTANWQAFNIQNPVQVNEILIKALSFDVQDHKK